MRAFQCFLWTAALLVCSQQARSQASTSDTGTGSAEHRGGRTRGVSTRAPNTVTDPGFASRLGSNVGLRAVPPVTMPPGVGNINSPGIQPLSLTPQPLPTGATPPIPNINSPGIAPGHRGTTTPHPSDGHSFGDGRGDPSRRGHFRKPLSGSRTVIIGVPIYPYTVYVTPPTPSASASTEQQTTRQWLGPTRYSGTEPSSGQSAEKIPSEPASSTQEPVITLLAFKDYTILAVVDYWLEGEMLHYVALSEIQTAVPLDQLDLVLTQQFNRERNVRFVLEARP